MEKTPPTTRCNIGVNPQFEQGCRQYLPAPTTIMEWNGNQPDGCGGKSRCSDVINGKRAGMCILDITRPPEGLAYIACAWDRRVDTGCDYKISGVVLQTACWNVLGSSALLDLKDCLFDKGRRHHGSHIGLRPSFFSKTGKTRCRYL